MTTTDQPLLVQAANWLERYAAELRESHTLRPDYRWPDHDDEHRKAHREHGELLDLAEKMRNRHIAQEPIAYAVRNDQGYWVGIFNNEETANFVAGKGQPSHNQYVTPLCLPITTDDPQKTLDIPGFLRRK